jgi:hypothetical protein
MSKQSPTNEIKACAKLPSMPFPYLVTLLILLPFVRKHSGFGITVIYAMRHSSFGNVLGDGLFCIGNRIYGILESNFFVRGATAPSRSPRRAHSGC